MVAGLAVLAAGVPSRGETRRRAAHRGMCWGELPANSAVPIAALMAETANRGCAAVAWPDAGASEPPRDRGDS